MLIGLHWRKRRRLVANTAHICVAHRWMEPSGGSSGCPSPVHLDSSQTGQRASAFHIRIVTIHQGFLTCGFCFQQTQYLMVNPTLVVFAILAGVSGNPDCPRFQTIDTHCVGKLKLPYIDSDILPAACKSYKEACQAGPSESACSEPQCGNSLQWLKVRWVSQNSKEITNARWSSMNHDTRSAVTLAGPR
jgi:hypothetical protein